MIVEFKIWGNPKAKDRIRLGFNNGKMYRFTPKATREYEKTVKMIYMGHKLKCFDENIPLGIKITFYQQTPKNKEIINKYSTSKPDLDNCAKIILDALNNVAYKDDSQISHLECEKFYTNDKPYVQVTIKELEKFGVPTKRSFEGEEDELRSK